MTTEKSKKRTSGLSKGIILQELLNFSGSSDDEHTSSPLSKPAHSSDKQGDRKSGSGGGDKENTHKGSGSRKKANTENGTALTSNTKPARINDKDCQTSNDSATFQEASSSKHLQLEKKTKKSAMCVKPKPKLSLDLQNMTLASLGISFDFSDSSDEGNERVEKKPVKLVCGNKNRDLPHSCKGTSKNIRKKPASLEDGSEEQYKRKTQSSNKISATVCKPPLSLDLPGSRLQPSTVSEALSSSDLRISPNDLGTGMKDSIPVPKADKTDKTAAKPKLMKNVVANDRKVDSQHNLKSLKHQFLQKQDVSVIRSAHLSGAFLLDASPSEESLLPLSESTRLDCPENALAPKQSFGHLLACPNLRGLVNSPLEENQDSSYEQLKIGAKKGVLETEPDNKVVGKDMKNNGLEDAQMASGVETSENDSEYMTCLTTPDVSSMYEAVDVSVQTSFKYGVSGSDGIAGVEDISAENPNDVCGSGEPESNREFANKDINLCEHHEGLEGEREDRGYSEGHSETEMDHDESLDLKLAPLQDSARQGKSCDDDSDLPLSSPGICSKKNVMILSTQKQAATSHDTCRSMSPPPDGSKLPSDSNYYSETRSDENSISGSSDVIHDNGNPVKGNNHEPFASLHEDLQDLELGSCVNKEEGIMSTKQESPQAGKTECHKMELPAVCLFPARKPGKGQHQETLSGSNGRRSPMKHADSSSEDDDSKLEAFFQKMRPPATRPDKKAVGNDDVGDFVVNDSDVTDSEEETCDDDLADSPCVAVLSDSEFLPRTRSSRGKTAKTGSSQHSTQYFSISEDDSEPCDEDDEDEDDEEEEEDCFQGLSTPRSIPTHSTSQTPRQASPKWYTPATSLKTKPGCGVDGTERTASVSSSRVQRKAESRAAWATPACLSQGGQRKTPMPLGFLRSLSLETPDHLRDGDARGYIVHFKRKQEELSSRLFKLFNFTVFENQLPSSLAVVWNKRLLKTAGVCKLKRVGDQYTATIELSTKVCDSAERVRDTLIHEMCHAAVWILNKAKEGHGRYWRYWAGKANRAHPEIPIIRRCHDYSINTKYIYRCVKCGYQLGRHSKSLDTEKKVCGHCRGRFQLLASDSRHGSNVPSVSSTPRTPNPFAMFVKENYGSVKREGGGLRHKEVMEALSKEFAKTKINFS